MEVCKVLNAAKTHHSCCLEKITYTVCAPLLVTPPVWYMHTHTKGQNRAQTSEKKQPWHLSMEGSMHRSHCY